MTRSSTSPTFTCQHGIQPCGLKFCGPVLDPSGYAEFSRSFIRHLERCGVPLCLDIVTYDKGRPQLGAEGKRIEELRQRKINYRAKIINANPDCFRGQREAGCVNIGFTMFEATRIPSRWVRSCNAMDGILVPSAWTRKVFEESGVTVPVRVAAPGIELPDDQKSQPSLLRSLVFRSLLGKPPRVHGKIRLPRMFRRPPVRWQAADLDDYAQAWKFYSIFQWTQRKNGQGLLRSYFAEFRKSDNVCLVLKTYRRDTTVAEQARVAVEIVAVRDSMQLSDHAPVLLVSELLSREQIGAIHRTCDCFVLPHRAEGFGMPHLEAMAHGHAVISTGFSGNLEFMGSGNSILLPYQLRPVAGMGWSDAYDGDMMWADPDLGALRKAMRQVYADRQYAAGIGRRARQDAESRFAWNQRVERFLIAVNEIIAMAQSRRGGAVEQPPPASAAA